MMAEMKQESKIIRESILQTTVRVSVKLLSLTGIWSHVFIRGRRILTPQRDKRLRREIHAEKVIWPCLPHVFSGRCGQGHHYRSAQNSDIREDVEINVLLGQFEVGLQAAWVAPPYGHDADMRFAHNSRNTHARWPGTVLNKRQVSLGFIS